MSSQLKIKKKTVYSITSLYYVVTSYNTDIPGLNSPNLFLIRSKKVEVELIIVFQKQAETHKKKLYVIWSKVEYCLSVPIQLS